MSVKNCCFILFCQKLHFPTVILAAGSLSAQIFGIFSLVIKSRVFPRYNIINFKCYVTVVFRV